MDTRPIDVPAAGGAPYVRRTLDQSKSRFKELLRQLEIHYDQDLARVEKLLQESEEAAPGHDEHPAPRAPAAIDLARVEKLLQESEEAATGHDEHPAPRAPAAIPELMEPSSLPGVHSAGLGTGAGNDRPPRMQQKPQALQVSLVPPGHVASEDAERQMSKRSHQATLMPPGVIISEDAEGAGSYTPRQMSKYSIAESARSYISQQVSQRSAVESAESWRSWSMSKPSGQMQIRPGMKAALGQEMCLKMDKFHHCCFQEWAKHVKLMNSSHDFQMSGEYLSAPTGPSRASARMSSSRRFSGVVDMSLQERSMAETFKVKQITSRGCTGQVMMLPTSRKRFVWEILGALFLAWDAFILPLSAFGVDDVPFVSMMEWVTLFYWTLDVPATLLTGFLQNGVIILEPHMVLRRYLRGWFAVDLVVLVPDWSTAMIKLIGHGQADVEKFGRLLRSLRIMRTLRALRLVKIKHLSRKVEDMITSESVFVIIRVALHSLLILGVAHILAALWYEIGKASGASSKPNWIGSYDLFGAEPVYVYLTAMHWTLTQFTPSSMGVEAQNVPERIFNICLILFGLCVFSSFVSSITSSMTQLASISSAQSKQLWMLRKYLKQNKIQGSLHFRVLRHVEHVYQKERDTLSETNVLALQRLSQQLKKELLATIGMECLRVHPLFENLREMLDSVAILSSTFTAGHLAREDLLFSDGAPSQGMHCPETGSIAYARFADSSFLGREEYMDVDIIEKGDWLSEAALWTDWIHIGTSQAREEARIVSVVAKDLRQTLKEDLTLLKLSSQYAREFVKMLQDRCYRGLADNLKGGSHMLNVELALEDVQKP